MAMINTGNNEVESTICSRCLGVGKLPNGSECSCRKKARVEAYKDYASFPRGFNDPSCCWKEYRDKEINDLLRYVEDIKNKIRNGEGVFIYGPPTSGKTFLAVALGKLAIGKDFRVKYYSSVEYLDIMRNKIVDDVPYQDLRYNMEVMDIIIWDRLQDIQNNIEWERSDLANSIRLRFDKGHADIVVTDQKSENFKKAFGDSLYNYLINNCININKVREEKIGD